MRIYKYTGLAFVCCLIYLFAYLAINNFQSEGFSLKTCALISMPLFIWMVYQRVTAMSEKARARESDEVIFMRMMEQIHHYEEMEREAGGGRLMKGILECREVARAIRRPESEDAYLTPPLRVVVQRRNQGKASFPRSRRFLINSVNDIIWHVLSAAAVQWLSTSSFPG